MKQHKAQVYEKVAALAAEHGGVTPQRISPQTHFINDLDFDSLTTVEFVMAVEDEFKITVPEAKAQELLTVEQVVNLIAEQE